MEKRNDSCSFQPNTNLVPTWYQHGTDPVTLVEEVIGFGDLWGPSGTSGDHLGTIWDMDSMKLSISLRNRTFRSARIDPSSLPKHRRTNLMKNYPYKKIKYPKRVKKDQKRGKQA